MIALDTHLVVALLHGTLTAAETAALADQEGSIAAIVLWELAMLAARRRVRLDLEAAIVRDRIGRLHVWPLTLAIAQQSTQLDFKSDPADHLIAATSIVQRVPLLTRDARIRGSQLVPLVGAR